MPSVRVEGDCEASRRVLFIGGYSGRGPLGGQAPPQPRRKRAIHERTIVVEGDNVSLRFISDDQQHGLLGLDFRRQAWLSGGTVKDRAE